MLTYAEGYILQAKAGLQVPGVGSYAHETPDDVGRGVAWGGGAKGQSFPKAPIPQYQSSEDKERSSVPGVGEYGGSVLERDARWPHAAAAGPQFTCCSGTKVHILTQLRQ